MVGWHWRERVGWHSSVLAFKVITTGLGFETFELQLRMQFLAVAWSPSVPDICTTAPPNQSMPYNLFRGRPSYSPPLPPSLRPSHKPSYTPPPVP